MEYAAETKKRILWLLGSLAAILSFYMPSTYASVTTGASRFFYDNGTSFTYPGTYDNVSRVNNVWYFGGVAYPPSSSSTSSVVTSVFNLMYSAVGVMALTGIVFVGSAIFIVMRGGDGVMAMAETSAVLLAVGVICIVGAVVLGSMQNMF